MFCIIMLICLPKGDKISFSESTVDVQCDLLPAMTSSPCKLVEELEGSELQGEGNSECNKDSFVMM